MRTITFAILFSILMVVPSYAMTGNKWLQFCNDEKSDFLMGMCFGYLVGVSNTTEMYNIRQFYAKEKGKEGLTAMPRYCKPQTVTDEQELKIVKKWLNEHPEELHEQLFVSYHFVMRETFPCTENTTP
jgi:hypothetical protein